MRRMERYKLLTAVAAVLLLPMAAGAQTLRGDFNMDGRVNISDVTAMANYLSTGTLGEVSPADRDTLTVNGVSFVMVRVKGGTYTLKYGKVRTIPDFWIGETEVTNELWWAVMGNEDHHNTNSPGNAVNGLTWFDCQAFTDSLSRLTGRNFRLPYADEWRFAASGGTLTRGYRYCGSDDINEVAMYSGTSSGLVNGQYFAVCTKAPNELGLYDMSGCVAELVQEMEQDSTDYGRVVYAEWAFGGCWRDAEDRCRPTSNYTLSWSDVSYPSRQYDCGMRLVIPTSDEPWEFIEWPEFY